MALQTKLYLVPLVEVEEVLEGETTVHTEYKTHLYIPRWQGTEETYHWMESHPALDPGWRFVELTVDEAIHQAIAADPDIVSL